MLSKFKLLCLNDLRKRKSLWAVVDNFAKALVVRASTYPPLTDYACLALICVLREFAQGYVLGSH